MCVSFIYRIGAIGRCIYVQQDKRNKFLIKSIDLLIIVACWHALISVRVCAFFLFFSLISNVSLLCSDSHRRNQVEFHKMHVQYAHNPIKV